MRNSRSPGEPFVVFVTVIGWLAGRWLFLVNLLLAIYLGFAVLAPVLMATNQQLAAQLVYWGFGFMCHQRPDRSYFLFGREIVYSLEFLDAWQGGPATSLLVGSPELGYKVALCQRDLGQFGASLLSGIAYGALRRRVRPLRWWGLVLMALPMALDGGLQLVGLWESNWWRRTLTGGLFGLATVWWAYPFLDDAMAQISGYVARTVAHDSASLR